MRRCTHVLMISLFGTSVLSSMREDSVKSLSSLIKKGKTCPWITFSPLRGVPGGVCWEGECLYLQFSPAVDKLLTVLRSEILFLALLRGTKFISRQMRLEEVERKITSVKDKSLMLSVMCYFGNRVVWKAWHSSKVVSVLFISQSWVFGIVLLREDAELPLHCLKYTSTAASVTYEAWYKISYAQCSVCSVTLLNFNNLVNFIVK